MATSDINLQHFPLFSLNETDMNSVGIRWSKYVSRFDNFLVAMNITTDPRKRALLLHYGGFELQDVYESLLNTGTTYAELKTAFAAYFDPKTNDCYETWNFQKTIQEDGETVQRYYLRLKEIAVRCTFPDENKAIKTQLVLGTSSSKLRKYCFTNKTATLQEILTRGKLMEDIEFQTKDIEMKQEKVEEKPYEDVHALRQEIANLKLQINQNSGKKFSYYVSKKSCFNCGNPYPHIGDCPAKDKICRTCGKRNHFAKVCRSRNQTQPSHLPHPPPINFLDTPGQPIPTSRDQVVYNKNKEEYLFSAEANNKDTLSRFKTNVVIDGHMIPVLIDTGCSTNILTAETFNYLRKQKQYKLSKSKVSLIPYGAQSSDTYLHALGTINCLVESNSTR